MNPTPVILSEVGVALARGPRVEGPQARRKPRERCKAFSLCSVRRVAAERQEVFFPLHSLLIAVEARVPGIRPHPCPTDYSRDSYLFRYSGLAPLQHLHHPIKIL